LGQELTLESSEYKNCCINRVKRKRGKIEEKYEKRMSKLLGYE
jgi:hypothetical protein